MSDLKLNESGDLEFIDGELTLFSDKDAFIAQSVKIRMKTFFGEWYLNNTLGVPYFQTILKKGVDKSVVDSLFRKVINETVGVKSITSFSSSIDNYTYSLSFKFLSSEGTILTIFENIDL